MRTRTQSFSLKGLGRAIIDILFGTDILSSQYSVDETYIKVKKVWMYLYRAVDSQGNTLEFLLSPRRDREAAKRFFSKALAAPHSSTPCVITVDKKAAYPKAFKELKAEGIMPNPCELRQRKYLNNLVEQDPRAHQTVGQARDGLLFIRDSVAINADVITRRSRAE